MELFEVLVDDGSHNIATAAIFASSEAAQSYIAQQNTMYGFVYTIRTSMLFTTAADAIAVDNAVMQARKALRKAM